MYAWYLVFSLMTLEDTNDTMVKSIQFIFSKLRRSIKFFNSIGLLEPPIEIPTRESGIKLKNNDPKWLPLRTINKIGNKYINSVKLQDLELKAQATLIRNNGETTLLVYLPILTNNTEYIGFIENKKGSVPISMRYRKVGNMNRPVKNKKVKWAFVSTILENNWENSNFTLEKFQKKTLQANYKLNFMLSNVQEDTIYNIIKEIVSDKKRTIFTQSFPIEENFIFEHAIVSLQYLPQRQA